MPPTPSETSWMLWLAGLVLALLMARGAWRGYKRGPLRQLAGPIALTVGIALGWALGPELGHSLLHGTSFPWLMRGAAGVLGLTCVTGLLVYGLAWWIGKRPEGLDEAESPVLGSMVGCWTGLLYFSLLVLAIATIASVQELIGGPQAAQKHLSIRARDQIANTPVTHWLKDWSPLPDRQRRLMTQTRLLMADPEARKRLMAMPEMRAMAAHPSFYQAWEDKKVRELLNNRDLSDFFDHPKVRALLADEAFQKQAAALDLPAIFDRALAVHK